MFLFGWIVLSIAVSIYANRLKRNPASWFWISVFISPVLSGALLLASGPIQPETAGIQELPMFEDRPEFNDDDGDSSVTLEYEKGDTSFERTELYYKEKKITFSSCNDGSSWDSEYEYKFDGPKVLSRLLESSSDHWGKTEIEVKDGVVLISAIKERYDQSEIHFISFEDKIKRLNTEIQWHEEVNLKLRFQIMKCHPDLFPDMELKRLIRTEYERIKYGSAEVVKALLSVGAEINLTGEYPEYKYPEEMNEEQRAILNNTFETASEKFNITHAELNNHIQILKDLDELLTPTRRKSVA